MDAAADIEGTITFGKGIGSVRFGFADEVAVQWLPDMDDDIQPIEALRESAMALARFAQGAVAAYLDGRPAGTFTIESTPA